jgi:hypothetical protein
MFLKVHPVGWYGIIEPCPPLGSAAALALNEKWCYSFGLCKSFVSIVAVSSISRGAGTNRRKLFQNITNLASIGITILDDAVTKWEWLAAQLSV